MASGCDWIAIGWMYPRAPGQRSASFLVSHVEAEGTAWPGPPPSQPPMTTTAQQVRLTGLRAGTQYEIRVAAFVGGQLSEWATSPAFRTAIATQMPEPPLAPEVLGDGCHRPVRLRLPAPQAGCRSAIEATLQYNRPELRSPPETPSWQNYGAPIISSDVDLYDLSPNSTYRFRLVAHNTAGRSHPGKATEPVIVCTEAAPDPPEARSTEFIGQNVALLQERLVMEIAQPVAVVGGALAVLISLLMLARSCFSSRRPTRGVRYQRASTTALEDEFDGEMKAEACAYDEWSAMLCVHVYVPASNQPVQIEMSAVGVTTCSSLLKQLRTVVSEVAGRQPAIAPEELSVVYEDGDSGVQHLLHSGCELDEVFSASRIVASIQLPKRPEVLWQSRKN